MSPSAAAKSAARSLSANDEALAGEMMRRALALAAAAADAGEVPVGAVVYDSVGEVWGEAGNETVQLHDISAHAEILALRRAGKRIGNHRLPAMRMAATLEPCPLCAFAIMQARLQCVHYGAADPKTGACGGAANLPANAALNHHTHFVGGLLADESAQLLRDFFAARR